MKVKVIERLRIATPLGIRFWDAATEQPVVSALRVTARPENHSRPVVAAQLTPSGIYAFHHLPGLREFEYANADLQHEAPAPPAKRYVIHVQDESERFLPIAFVAAAPFLGIFPNGSTSPPAPIGFDLFSRPTRKPPGGFAEVRAELWDVDRGQPAANAVLEIIVNATRRYHGLSEASGKVATFFPYPPVSVSLASPPIGSTIALSEQTWNVRIRLYYAPHLVTGFAGLTEPNLRTVLEQPSGLMFPELAGVNEFQQEIAFGRTTVLRTEEGARLLVSSGSSPP